MKCPQCNAEILNDRINIMNDIAQCVKCNHIFKVSENLISDDRSFSMDAPPKGAWIRRGRESLVIGATTRSALAFFLVPFMVVWSGMSIGIIYGSQIISGEFNLISTLFGIPFLMGSIIFWSIAFMAIWGKVEVTVNNDGGSAFIGIGGLGVTKRFLWSEVSTIRETFSFNRNSSSAGTRISMEGVKKITFGSQLSDGRRYYMLKALQTIMIKVKQHGDFLYYS